MRFELSDEQVEFSEAVRALLADTCPPDAVRSAWSDPVLAGGGTADGHGRVAAAWQALAEMGVLGIMVPEANGGLGMGDEDLTPLLTEAGRVALPDPLSATAGVAVGTLQRAFDRPSSGAIADLLAGIAAGEVSVGVMFASSDRVDGVSSGVVSVSDLVPSVSTLDLLIVHSGDSVTLVDRDAMEINPVDSVDGARDLGRVNVNGGDVLFEGPVAEGATIAAYDRAALYSAAELIGLSDRMIQMAVAYASERQQFGVAIGTFQAVKHHLANAAMVLEFARPLVMRAAHSVAYGDSESSQHVSMAKARAARAADAVARTSLQVHGGIGYTVEYDLHLFMKRAWALGREFGDAAFHTRRVRRSLALT